MRVPGIFHMTSMWCELRDDAGPSRLVRGSEPSARLGVEVPNKIGKRDTRLRVKLRQEKIVIVRPSKGFIQYSQGQREG
jgi:hypothetical protein